MLISSLHRAQIVEIEKKNRKDRTMKKPEIIQGYKRFMQGADRKDQILHYSPRSRKTMKWTKKFVFFIVHMAGLNIFILLKNYTTNQKQKGKGYAFKDFILDCVQKMMKSEEEEDERDSMG